METSQVAAVILAAGEATRYGSPKQLLDWEGHSLAAHAADTAWSAGLAPVVVVVGAHAEEVILELAGRPVTIVHNYRWAEGISTSLNVGVSALPPEVAGSVFLPVDQPLVTPGLLKALVARWQETGAAIVAPRTNGEERGAPALFSRALFPRLARLDGDIGGRTLFAAYAEQLAHLEVADAMLLTDIDTPAAYERLRAYAAQHVSGLDFAAVRGLICDMDGVLWRGSHPLPGLHDLFARLEAWQLPHVLVTNNSSRTPEQYVRKLRQMGIMTTEEHVLNSAIAAAHYVADQQPGATVYALGGPGLMQALEGRGLHLVDAEAAAADYVVVGWDLQFTWDKMAAATRLILDGARFVGTNPDLTYPVETHLAPGNGAQLAALEAATGVAPIIAGKPAPPLYTQAMERMGSTAATTLVIGDRLDTDVLGGLRLGMPAALVLTGISDRDELTRSPIRPTATFAGLPELLAAWQKEKTNA